MVVVVASELVLVVEGDGVGPAVETVVLEISILYIFPFTIQ